MTTDNSLDAQRRQQMAAYYEQYYDDLRAYLVRRLPYSDCADDVCQDVFLHVMLHGKMVTPVTAHSYFFTVAHNLLTDHLRRFYVKESKRDHLCRVMERATDGQRMVEQRDLCQVVSRFVDSMPQRRKEVFRLVDMCEYTVGDVAERFNLSIRTVEAHLYIARKEVRQYAACL